MEKKVEEVIRSINKCKTTITTRTTTKWLRLTRNYTSGRVEKTKKKQKNKTKPHFIYVIKKIKESYLRNVKVANLFNVFE